MALSMLIKRMKHSLIQLRLHSSEAEKWLCFLWVPVTPSFAAVAESRSAPDGSLSTFHFPPLLLLSLGLSPLFSLLLLICILKIKTLSDIYHFKSFFKVSFRAIKHIYIACKYHGYLYPGIVHHPKQKLSPLGSNCWLPPTPVPHHHILQYSVMGRDLNSLKMPCTGGRGHTLL